MSIAKRAANNVFWLFISEVCSKGAMFIGTVYLARALGVEAFGIYSLALATVVYMWCFTDVGVSAYGTREVAQYPDRAAGLLNELNSLRLLIAIICFLLLGAGLFFIDMPARTKWTLITAGFYVIAYALSPDWMLKGIEKMEYIALGNLTVAISFLVSIYWLVNTPENVVMAALCRSMAFLLGSIVILTFLGKKIGFSFSFVFSPASWWGHIKESWYFAANRGLDNLSKFISIFFLGVLATTGEIGVFSAPHRLIILIIGGAAVIPQAFYPIFSNLHHTDNEMFQKTYRAFQNLMLYIGLPFGIMGMSLGEDLVKSLYGDNYLGGGAILKILVWLIPLTFLKKNYNISLASAGFQKFIMTANMIGGIINIAFCCLLIPAYGGKGAAAAMLVAESLVLVILGFVFALKLYKYKLLNNYFIRIIMANIGLGLVLSRIHYHLTLRLVAGVLAYAALSFICGVITKETVLKVYRGAINA